MLTPQAPETDRGIETIYLPADLAEQGIAESMLRDAGIPFQSKSDSLQHMVGWGQTGGGANPLIGPVEIQVPAAYAAEARSLFEPGLALENEELAEEVPAELEPSAVAEDDSRVAKVRHAALASLVFSFFLFAPVGLVLGLWALALTKEGDVPTRWKFFAAAGVFYGIVGTGMLLTNFWV